MQIDSDVSVLDPVRILKLGSCCFILHILFTFLLFLKCSCENVDRIEINIIERNWPKTIGIYCGRKQPPMLMSADYRLQVVFISTPSPTQTSGFIIQYKFRTGKRKDNKRGAIHTFFFVCFYVWEQSQSIVKS